MDTALIGCNPLQCSPSSQELRLGLKKRSSLAAPRNAAARRASMIIRNVASDSKVSQQTKTSKPSDKSLALGATLVIRKRAPSSLLDIFSKGLDVFLSSDPQASDIVVQLVSTTLDPSTGRGKLSEVFSFEESTQTEETINYTANLAVSSDFGTPGAVLVTNKHTAEFFLETITLRGRQIDPISFCCYSWVNSPPKGGENQQQQHPFRIFFCNEAFLPSLTPPGLKDLRETELKLLRGDGKGVRRTGERVYDYDVYNDLGNPDHGEHLKRPVAGGVATPYPRRCRTGRPPTKTDPLSETRLGTLKKNYVPRDEDFDDIKAQAFSSGRLRAVALRLVPSIRTHFTETPNEFDNFTDIDRLYFEGIRLQGAASKAESGFVFESLKRILNMGDSFSNSLKYPLPPLFEKDKFSWTRDSEFGRQMLAGMNPLKIERLTVFPPRSGLDEKTYGSLESALKKEELEKFLDGLSVEEAIETEKLFILDYHDDFLPLVNRINALEDRKTYATRTIFFLDSFDLFRPVAIELSLPSSSKLPKGEKRTFYPEKDATSFWFWQIAEAHVCSNHAAYHQVVSHWLQTHAAMEPYVIATNRQLSAMHPVAKLLDPHLRYTMQINATARQTLISADGVIENCFTPGRYSLELSAAAYKTWRFDNQGLPADLLQRGMAVKDPKSPKYPKSPEDLRLVIKDYPYAADGLLIWFALRSWVETYLSIYYKEDEDIARDEELQSWWEEIKTKGHPDKKEGWPELSSKDDFTEILTTMMWVASGHHAAVNFGQFLYSGYVPNMPAMTRRLAPKKGEEEYKMLMAKPQQFMLRLLPNQVQTTTVMSVLQLLSTHHPDEEYLGERTQKYWTSNIEAIKAAEKLRRDLNGIQETIIHRNKDHRLKHRHGAGIPPYELLKPFSRPGITASGVPNSVSI